ncbi:hypothetical protein ACTUVM_003446 [Azotobacter vinelandii]
MLQFDHVEIPFKNHGKGYRLVALLPSAGEEIPWGMATAGIVLRKESPPVGA